MAFTPSLTPQVQLQAPCMLFEYLELYHICVTGKTLCIYIYIFFPKEP